MAQAREQIRTAPLKRLRVAKTDVARNATTGQFVLIHAGEEVAEIPLTKARFRRIADKERVLGKMISGHADAAAKAERTGKDYVIACRVSPDGRAVEVEEAETRSAADGPLEAALARAKDRVPTRGVASKSPSP